MFSNFDDVKTIFKTALIEQTEFDSCSSVGISDDKAVKVEDSVRIPVPDLDEVCCASLRDVACRTQVPRRFASLRAKRSSPYLFQIDEDLFPFPSRRKMLRLYTASPSQSHFAFSIR